MGGGSFGIAFAGGYLGLIHLVGLNLLQHSQQWQATDVFRVAPLAGPAGLCRGARWAVLCCLTLPIFAGIRAGYLADSRHKPAVDPAASWDYRAARLLRWWRAWAGKGVPLSMPIEEAKAAQRGLTMMGVMLIAMALSGLAVWSWSSGWFGWVDSR